MKLLSDLTLTHLVIWGPFVVSVLLAFLLPARLRTISIEGQDSPDFLFPAKVPWTKKQLLSAAVAVLLLTIAGGLAPWLERPVERRGATVVLYEKGFLNWLRPNFEFFGRRSAGMFGLLPDFIESIGLRAQRTSSLTLATLRGASVLFIANPEGPLPKSEQDAVWKFVRGGGHLILAGDHTSLRGGWGNPLNILLEPTDIRFRTDSANFFTGGWIHGYRFPMTPLTAGFRPDQNEPALVVGASLEIGSKARPLVIGRWGYSDDPALADSASGFLGDLKYSPGEHIGDLVLVATQQMGRGRVTALGDTSPFFNGILTISYSFVSRLFLWAAALSPDPPFRLYLTNCVLALLLGLILAHVSSRFSSVLIAGALGATILGSWGIHQQAQWSPPFESGHIAFLDASHLPQHQPGIWEDPGIMGLPVNMMRYGYQTYFLDRFDNNLLKKAKLLALITPRREVTDRETAQLAEWVQAGGTLLISTGAEEEAPIRSLLRHFGLALQPIPLGGLDIESEFGLVQTKEAWPLEFAPGDRQPGQAQVILSWRDYPIAMRLHQGDGQVIVVGDSKFFCNYNLEHDNHAHISNVKFLGSLLPPVEDVADEVENFMKGQELGGENEEGSDTKKPEP
ncbi:MAG: hypothetical protein GTO29_14810 [Candidatus Latescibacteria bacterium]|nr:hypothetical protein [Candidatus Latescibacterota bacterium]NIO57421.1 hypothetical protein [Candidatus Latescibacterota bacterium]